MSLGASALQCGNGLVRVTEVIQTPKSSSLQDWDDDSAYSTIFLVVDAIGVVSALASLPFALRNFWNVLSRQRAFTARAITLAKLKQMNRFDRLKVIREVFEEAAKTPEGRAALKKAAAEAKVATASLENGVTMSVRRAASMTHVISKETQKRLVYGILGLLNSFGGIGGSSTPSRFSGSASGSVNWVINLVDSG